MDCIRWDTTETFDNIDYTFDFECIPQVHLAEIHLLGEGDIITKGTLVLLGIIDLYGISGFTVDVQKNLHAAFNALGYGELNIDSTLNLYKRISCVSNFTTLTSCISDFCSTVKEYSDLKEKIENISDFKYIINK